MKLSITWQQLPFNLNASGVARKPRERDFEDAGALGILLTNGRGVVLTPISLPLAMPLAGV